MIMIWQCYAKKKRKAWDVSAETQCNLGTHGLRLEPKHWLRHHCILSIRPRRCRCFHQRSGLQNCMQKSSMHYQSSHICWLHKASVGPTVEWPPKINLNPRLSFKNHQSWWIPELSQLKNLRPHPRLRPPLSNACSRSPRLSQLQPHHSPVYVGKSSSNQPFRRSYGPPWFNQSKTRQAAKPG